MSHAKRLFIFMSAFGSYRAYEYSESVEFCGGYRAGRPMAPAQDIIYG